MQRFTNFHLCGHAICILHADIKPTYLIPNLYIYIYMQPCCNAAYPCMNNVNVYCVCERLKINFYLCCISQTLQHQFRTICWKNTLGLLHALRPPSRSRRLQVFACFVLWARRAPGIHRRTYSFCHISSSLLLVSRSPYAVIRLTIGSISMTLTRLQYIFSFLLGSFITALTFYMQGRLLSLNAWFSHNYL